MLLPPFPLCRADLRGVFGGSHFYYTMPSPAFEPKLPFSGKIFLAPASRIGLSFSFPPLHDGPCKQFSCDRSFSCQTIFLRTGPPGGSGTGAGAGFCPDRSFSCPSRMARMMSCPFPLNRPGLSSSSLFQPFLPIAISGQKKKKPVRPLFFYFNIFFV